MTQQELDTMVQEELEKRHKARCIVLTYGEAEEAYNALYGMREKLKKIRNRAEKFKSDDSFKLCEQLTYRLDLMNKLITRLEKKLKW